MEQQLSLSSPVLVATTTNTPQVPLQERQQGVPVIKRFKVPLPPVPPFNESQGQSGVQIEFGNGSSSLTPAYQNQLNQQPLSQQQQQQQRRQDIQGGGFQNRGSSQSPSTSPTMAPPQMSAQQFQNYQKSRNATRERSSDLSALTMGSASDSVVQSQGGSNSAALNKELYYEWLNRYWDVYQRQGINWEKIAEYYERHNFYPWDIPRDQGEKARPSSSTYGTSPIQLQKEYPNRNYPEPNIIGAPMSSGSISKGTPATSYVGGRIQQYMTSTYSHPPSQVSTSTSQKEYYPEFSYVSSQQLQSIPFQSQSVHSQPQRLQEWQHTIPYYQRTETKADDDNTSANPSAAAAWVVQAAAAVASATTKEDQTRLNSNLASVLMSRVNNGDGVGSNSGGQQFQQYQDHHQQQQYQRSPSLLYTQSTASIRPAAGSGFVSTYGSTSEEGSYSYSGSTFMPSSVVIQSTGRYSMPTTAPQYSPTRRFGDRTTSTSQWSTLDQGSGGMQDMGATAPVTGYSHSHFQYRSVIRKLEQTATRPDEDIFSVGGESSSRFMPPFEPTPFTQ